MSYIQYTYDPDDPDSIREGRTKALGQFYLAMIFLGGTLGSVIYYVYNWVQTLKGIISNHLYFSIGTILVMSIYDFFIIAYVDHPNRKIQFAKKYFPTIASGFVDLSGIIAAIVAIKSICHKNGGILLLIFSLFVVIIFSTLIYIINRDSNIRGFKVRLFTSKTIPPASDSPLTTFPPKTATSSFVSAESIFCHKCGKKLPKDSIYCSHCGFKLNE